ncbi:MAG: radical SAM protein [Spirochaetia bacterium]|nr:radical SAM protein [Spirochaetia bacterium]
MAEIEIHSCTFENDVMSFPMGALCIQTAINTSSLPHADLIRHNMDSDPEAAARKCVSRHPKAVGLSLYIWNAEWFRTFAEKLHSTCPDIMIFAGGPQISAFGDTLPPYLSFAVRGEGEITTVEKLLEFFSTGTTERKIHDAALPDTEKLESVFLSGNADVCLKDTDSVLLEMTRGCPYKCAFCFESRGNRTVRDFPLERISREIDCLIKHNIVNVFVLDPTFNLNRKRAKTILRMLLEKSPEEMHYTFEIRAELLDREMAALFAELNCSLQIGLQSSNKDVLRNIGREWNKELFTKNVKMLAKLGIPFGLDIIAGLPGDSLSSFMETIDYATSLQPSNIDCFVLSILPGTELELTAPGLGIVCGGENNTVESTPTFSTQELAEARRIKKAMDLFYTRGQSCIWLHSILDALGMTTHELFSSFADWMERKGLTENDDIWKMQLEFVTGLLRKAGKSALINAATSFMKLHQGFSYVMETGETVSIQLSYSPSKLALLDTMSLEDFAARYREKKCTPCLTLEDGEVMIY